MLYDKPFELDDEPRVPKAMRWHLHRILRGARAITVSEVADGGTKKINGLKLQVKATPGSMPEDSLDDIAEAVCRIMHHRWVETNLNAGEGEVVAIHCRISSKVDAPSRGQPKSPSFDWTYDPDGTTSEIDEIEQLERTSLMQILESNERARETDRLHISEMQDRFLELIQHISAPMSQIGQILEYAGGLSLQGSQMMVSALQTTFSMEALKAQEEQRTRRSEMMWQRVGGWLDVAVPEGIKQVITIFGKKKSEYDARRRAEQQANDEDEDEGDWRPPQPQGDPQAPDPSTHEPRPQTVEDDPVVQKTMEFPIAGLCQAFGDSLTAQQNRSLDQLMTKREKATFFDVCCAETDDDAIAAYTALEESLPPQKLLGLNAIMDDEQRQIFMQVRAMIAKVRKKEEEEGKGGGKKK